MNRVIVVSVDLSLEELLREDSDPLPSSRLTVNEMTLLVRDHYFLGIKSVLIRTDDLVSNYLEYGMVTYIALLCTGCTQCAGHRSVLHEC